MPHRADVYSSLLAGYAIAVITLAVVFAAGGAGTFNPHEFATPAEAFLFGMFAWGVLLLVGSGAPFALLCWPLRSTRLRLPVALLVGAVAGTSVFVIAGTGSARAIVRALGAPDLAQAVVPGVITGIAVSSLFVFGQTVRRLTRRSS